MNSLVDILEKISKRMLKRNKGMAVSPTLPGNSIKSIVSSYNATKTAYKANINRNMRAFMAGTISKDEYVKLQRAEIKQAFSDAYLAGKRFGTGNFSADLDAVEKRSLVAIVGREAEFMSRFADDISSNSGKMSYSRRLQMYVDSLNAVFNFGRVVYIPEESVIYWTLGVTDKHCMDCLVFAANNPYTKRTLPTIPKAGDTQCLSNCLCTLVYSNTSSVEEQEYVDLISKIPPGNVKDIPTKEQYRYLVSIRDDYYYNLFQYQITGNDEFKALYMSKKKEFAKYITNSNISFPMYFYQRDAIRELNQFRKSVSFTLVSNVVDVQPSDFVSFFVGNKQMYGSIQRIDNSTDILVKTLEGLLFTVKPTTNIIFKEKKE